jgi:biopolymer transport protein ExbB
MLTDLFTPFFDFLDAGGHVLYLILLLLVALWWVMLDRFWFFVSTYPKHKKRVLQEWEDVANKKNWFGESIRKQLISELDCGLSKNIKLIQGMIALLPMLGLLGTVTGMIQVFEVLAITGTSNPRTMADGVSAATIPTMAGMLAALIALPIHSQIDRIYKRELHKVHEDMPTAIDE